MGNSIHAPVLSGRKSGSSRLGILAALPLPPPGHYNLDSTELGPGFQETDSYLKRRKKKKENEWATFSAATT